jgi:hypothetical protein
VLPAGTLSAPAGQRSLFGDFGANRKMRKKAMGSETATNLEQIERRLLAAFERHGNDGRAITIESLAATAGVAGHAKELALALEHLVERGLVRRAGEDPIPGSAIAFRLVTRVPREPVDKAENRPAPLGLPSTPAEQMPPRELVKSAQPGRASVPSG